MKDVICENKGRIRAIIKKLSGSYNEDLEQEVYIKIWRYFPSYKEVGKFSQWIGAVTANVCRDYFKSRQYRQEAAKIGDEELVAEEWAMGRSQEEILDGKMRQKLILEAVNSLPVPMRKVVVLFEFEEMSYEQIAKKTGVPVGTVKSRLFKARQILSRKLHYLKGE